MHSNDEVVKLLQSYKTNICKALKKGVSLYLKDGVIQWTPSQGGGAVHGGGEGFESPKIGESFGHFLNASLVEDIFERLEPIEKKVMFYRYINHDWETKNGRYEGLYVKEIAKLLGVSESTIYRTLSRAFGHVKRIWHEFENDR